MTTARDSNSSRIPWADRLLGIPLFWKLIAGNAVIVLVAGLVGLYLGLRVAPDVGEGVLTGISVTALTAVVAGGVFLNGVLVHLALAPLRRLEQTARDVGRGRLDARAGSSPLADAELAQLMDRFDAMLDSLERARQRQRELARHLLEAEERTRSRIARFLYDETAQELAALMLQAPTARKSPESADPVEFLEDVRERLADALSGVRAAARRLLPPELDDLGLGAALRAEARTFEQQTGIPVNVETAPDVPERSRAESLTLFRIVQEALTTATAQGTDDPVLVRLGMEDGALVCEVLRPGSGLARDLRTPRPPSVGIDELRERASHAGAAVELLERSQADGIRMRLPSADDVYPADPAEGVMEVGTEVPTTSEGGADVVR